MKLVVGLGNPGSKYEGTRHNVGFELLNRLDQRWGKLDRREGFSGLYSQTVRNGSKLFLLWPTTFMNLSGQSVLQLRDFYRIPTAEILLICDDLALPVGKIRVRARGSAGGQKGLLDVIKRLGTEEIPRLRIGIGSTPESWDTKDYVLSRFTEAEKPQIQDGLITAMNAVEVWLDQGIDVCMNQFNR